MRGVNRVEPEQVETQPDFSSRHEDGSRTDALLDKCSESSSRRRHSTAAVFNSSWHDTAPKDLGKYVTRSKWINSGDSRGRSVKPRGSLSVVLFSRSSRRQLTVREESEGGVMLEEGGELPTRTLERLSSLETVGLPHLA